MSDGEVNGDDVLCPFETRLWALHQDVILRFGCYTIFRWTRINVPEMTDSIIEWFVPVDHPMSYEVAAHLERELAHLRRPPHDVAGTPWPGEQVLISVMKFRGVEPYLPEESARRIASEATANLMASLAEMRKRKQG